jgi:hypothetical protein
MTIKDGLGHIWPTLLLSKEIISNAGSYDEVETRPDEMEGLGREFIELFYRFRDWLKRVGKTARVYRNNSLWYELAATESVHALYMLSCSTSAGCVRQTAQDSTISNATFLHPNIYSIRPKCCFGPHFMAVKGRTKDRICPTSQLLKPTFPHGFQSISSGRER